MARETKTKPVTFIDYNFVAYPEGTIAFDKELNIENLNLQYGDLLQVCPSPGTKSIILKKKELPLEKQ